MQQHLVLNGDALRIRTRNKIGGLRRKILRLWQHLFYDLVLFLVHFSAARICTRVFCTAKLFVAPEGLIFAAKADHHLHGHVMMVGIVKH